MEGMSGIKKTNNIQNIEEFPVFHLWPYSPIQSVSKKKKEGETE